MKGLRKAVKISAAVVLSITVLTIIIFGCVLIFTYKNINFDLDERLFESSRHYNSTTFFAADKEGGYIPIETSGSINKLHYPTSEISPLLKKGIVSVEDKIFFEHRGIDIKRTLLAAVNYIFKKEKVFGASTITQQVVKNISGDNKVKLSRKLAEIIRAGHIEKIYTKEEILELYLNVIPMGDNIFGVGAAAVAYFGKEPSELTAAEAATLIGITNAPTAYNPYSNPENCKNKRNIVLSVMYNDGIIDEEVYLEAKGTELSVIPREERDGRVDSWFTEAVIDEVSRDLAEEYSITESAAMLMLLGGGFSVYTTMDTDVQETLEYYFENKSNFPDEINNGLNLAMVVADSVTGDLVGVVGRVGKKTANRLLDHSRVPHIPGSTLKPIALYAPLIDEGVINSATVFDDVPVSFTKNGDEYREYPRNSPFVYDGLITVKDALRLSKNTVAVRLCNILSPRRVFDILRNEYGFESLAEREKTSDGRVITDIALSPMALGQLSYGVSLMKLTESYGVFPGDGVLKNMRSYTSVADYSGKVVLTKEKTEKRILKTGTARIMNTLLEGVVEDGTAGKITLCEIVDTAGSRDKTFIGYTPYYTAGIWCGYESGGGSVSGISPDHLEIWDTVMKDIHSERIKTEEYIKSFPLDGLVRLPFCKDSGEVFSDVCKYDPRGTRVDFGYFSPDNCPSEECTRHVMCLYDSLKKGIATESCPRENIVTVSLIKVWDRSFPKEIFVTDAEYVYRDVDGYVGFSSNPMQPFFYYTIPEGEFVGKSKREKQFNSGCEGHSSD